MFTFKPLTVQLTEQIASQQAEIQTLSSAIAELRAQQRDIIRNIKVDMVENAKEYVGILAEDMSDILADSIQDRIDNTLNDGEYICRGDFSRILDEFNTVTYEDMPNIRDEIKDEIKDDIRDIATEIADTQIGEAFEGMKDEIMDEIKEMIGVEITEFASNKLPEYIRDFFDNADIRLKF